MSMRVIQQTGSLRETDDFVLFLMNVVETVCKDTGRDPAEAVMVLLTGAAQFYRIFAKQPDDNLGLYRALDKAIIAANEFFDIEEIKPEEADHGSLQ